LTAELVIAADGLPARKAGDYAKQKLSFFDQFCPEALKVTNRNPRRVFVDLFAGPGLNVVPQTGEEILGSPLRVLTLRGRAHGSLHPFTAAHFVNIDGEQSTALDRRLALRCQAAESHISRRNLHVYCGNANKEVRQIMTAIDKRAYILAFADIEGPTDLPFATLKALRNQGHTSIDLYVLYPTRGISRMLAYDPDEREARAGKALDAYYGTRKWRDIIEGRLTDEQSDEAAARLRDCYAEQLGTLWSKVVPLKRTRSGPRRVEYDMLFASNNAIADKLAKWSAKQPSEGGYDRGQTRLF
jgi:three-Cys-motif partner protein